MRLLIQSRSGRDVVPGGVTVPEEASVEDLQNAIHSRKRALYPSRQRLTLPQQPGSGKKPTVLASGKKLSDFELFDGATVVVKDLGPQVGYRTVFFWEYFGPLVVYALIYSFPQFVYFHQRKIPEKGFVQNLAVLYWSFHYIKRILETFFVHRFSHATMPIFNLFKNCSYYWGFAAYVSYFVNHPLYTEPSQSLAAGLFLLALACQAANFRCHVILANLRPPGTTTGYTIPRGFLFDFITCPNYTAEICGWLCFTVATHSLPAAFFAVAGAAQMLQWAIAKHARLRKNFDGKDGRAKYPRRWIMLPPVL